VCARNVGRVWHSLKGKGCNQEIKEGRKEEEKMSRFEGRRLGTFFSVLYLAEKEPWCCFAQRCGIWLPDGQFCHRSSKPCPCLGTHSPGVMMTTMIC